MAVEDKGNIDYKKPFCYILVGPSGTGKSQVCDQLKNHPSLSEATVISSESLISDLSKDTGKKKSEIFRWTNSAELRRRVKAKVSESVYHRRNIIVDRCNLTRRSRNVVTKLLPEDYNVVMVVMRCDPEDILSNIDDIPGTNNQILTKDSVRKMFEVYEDPLPHEYDVLIEHRIEKTK